MPRRSRPGGVCPSLRGCVAAAVLTAAAAALATWSRLPAWGLDPSWDPAGRALPAELRPAPPVRASSAGGAGGVPAPGAADLAGGGAGGLAGSAAGPHGSASAGAGSGGGLQGGAGGVAAGAAPTAGPAKGGGRYRIFTYWNYPTGANPLVHLNIDSWRAHSPPDTEVVFVNDSNFKTLVPDAPREWYQLPYPAAKSDVVRAAVLYHQGGLYMDTDFMALGPLEKVFAKLDEGWDVVAYTDGKVEGEKSGDCSAPKDRYSSNFLAARAGNPWSRTWWSNLKMKLTRLCGEGEFEKEKICCHEAFAPEPEKRPCHIPWAQLEHLKTPDNDHDRKGPPRDDPTKAKTKKVSRSDSFPEAEKEAILQRVEQGRAVAALVPNGTRLYCFRGPEGMAAHAVGQIYWQPWDSVAQKTKHELEDGKKYYSDFDCREEGDGDLACTRGNWGKQPRTFQRFFKRVSYHLFFSTHKASVKSKEQALNEHWLLSEMYRRSFAQDGGP